MSEGTEHIPTPPCAECGAPQAEGQQICVDCGASARTREPLLRRGVAVLSLTAFAVLVVAAAAFGVTADLGSTVIHDPAAKVAAAPAASTATTPAPAPAPTPAPPATSTVPTPAAPPPASTTVAKPSSPAPAATSSSPATSPSTTTTQHHTTAHVPAKPVRHHTNSNQPTWQGDPPYSATLFDPAGSGTDEHAGAARLAVDQKLNTAWTSGDHPGGLGKPGVGLVLETGGSQTYSALGIDTATPGFDVSIYSSADSSPPTAAPGTPGSGWTFEGKKNGVTTHQRLGLRGATPQPSYYLVWVTKLPGGKPRVGLSEITMVL